jgi:methionyl-tRNA formyltransferase
MNIIIITQDEPFYLAETFNYLLQNLSNNIKVVGCVLTAASPFGKTESFGKKLLKTYQVYGILFVIHYGFKYIISKINPNKRISNILNKFSIPIIQIQGSINSEKSLARIKSYNPDLLISILGSQIFKQPLIDLAPKGCLNLHTALLPRYRGILPSFWVLKNNEKETGVSVFFVNKGIDSGPILVQKYISIPEGMTQSQLIKLSKKIGMDAIIEAIKLIQQGNYTLIPNPDEEKTYFSFPSREDVKSFYKAGKNSTNEYSYL